MAELEESPRDVTQLLVRWSQGDENALNDLTPLVYEELRRLAQAYLRHERPGHTLESTALVHEAYMRMVEQKEVQWHSRNQFFGLAASLIRRILVDHARARLAAKRGGHGVKLPLDEAMTAAEQKDSELVALHDALQALAARDEQQAHIVELRYFAGLTIEETAELVHVSPATVKRDWAIAKAFLKREMLRNGAG
jgi:RNA polymerase sigma factor (TIGR02999 family)